MRPAITFPMELLIIDDHQMWREAVAAVMRQEFGPETTARQARDTEQALRIAEDHLNLSAVLLDLTLANRAQQCWRYKRSTNIDRDCQSSGCPHPKTRRTSVAHSI